MNNPIKFKLTPEQQQLEESMINILIKGFDLLNLSDFKRVKRVSDILQGVKYVKNVTQWSIYHTAYSALINREAVCSGYAWAMTELINKSGGECYYVTGYKKNTYHACCVVRVDNKYYYVDPTANAQLIVPYCFLSGKDYNKIFKADEEYEDVIKNINKHSYFVQKIIDFFN